MHRMATKKTIIAIIVIFMIALTLEIIGMYYAYNVLQLQNKNSLELKMDFITKGVVRQTKNRIAQIQYTVLRTAIFFSKFKNNISHSMYHEIFQMDKNPSATSVETVIWLPKIYYDEKEGYEDYISNANTINYTINEYNETDKRVYPVQKRDYYFPYVYSEPPVKILENISGFDFYSYPETKALIDFAIASTNSTGSYRTQIINEFNNPYSYGVILNELAFIDMNNKSVDNIVGIVMAVINIGDIMSISIDNYDFVIDRDNIDIIVFDITDDNICNNKTLNMSLLYKENKPAYKDIWFYDDLPKYDYMFTINMYVRNRLWNVNLRLLDGFVEKNTNYTDKYIIISISLALFFFDICMCVLAYQKYQEVEKREIANKMLGYVNHEVRNPLNVITGMIEITTSVLNSKLRKGNEDIIIQKDEMKSIISDLCTAGSSCSMMRHIVNDILDIRKLESNKLEINNDYIELAKFCKKIKKTITPKILEKIDLVFLINIDDELKQKLIFVDKIRLEQILLNFIFNSIKFTVDGSITLMIKKKDRNIVFEVIDTGRGIPDETKNLIFQPFHQTNKEDGSRYGGIGLGLYLCKMLTTCMGGMIGFTSQYGMGSTFYIEIPLKTKDMLKDDEKECSCCQSSNRYDDNDANNHMINIIDDTCNIPESKLLLIDLKKYNGDEY
jgi:signal transduction histidine kinase